MLQHIEKAIRAALTGGTAGPLVSGRVYNEMAPQGAALPYIVMALNAGGKTNRTPTDEGDVRHVVKVISTSASEAAQVAGAIEADLHEVSLALDAPWTAYRCQALTVVKYLEQVERVQYFHSGWIVRTRVSK
jgi:hypothetical protein